MAEKMLTCREAAPLLRLHPETVMKMLRSGMLSGVKVGRKWLVSESEIERVLREGTAPKGRDSHSRSNYEQYGSSGDSVELAGEGRVIDASQLKLLAPSASSVVKWETRGGEQRGAHVIG